MSARAAPSTTTMSDLVSASQVRPQSTTASTVTATDSENPIELSGDQVAPSSDSDSDLEPQAPPPPKRSTVLASMLQERHQLSPKKGGLHEYLLQQCTPRKKTPSPVLVVEDEGTPPRPPFLPNDLHPEVERTLIHINARRRPLVEPRVQLDHIVSKYNYVIGEIRDELMHAPIHSYDYITRLAEKTTSDSKLLRYSQKYGWEIVFDYEVWNPILQAESKSMHLRDWYGVYMHYWKLLRNLYFSSHYLSCHHCSYMPCSWYRYTFIQFLKFELQEGVVGCTPEVRQYARDLWLDSLEEDYTKAAGQVESNRNSLEAAQTMFDAAEKKCTDLAVLIHQLHTEDTA